MLDNEKQITEPVGTPIEDTSDRRTDFQKWSDSFRTKTAPRFFHKSVTIIPPEKEGDKPSFRTSTLQWKDDGKPKGKRAKRWAKRQRVAELKKQKEQ